MVLLTPYMKPVVKRDGVGDSAGVGEGPPPRRYTPDMNPVVKRDGVGDSAGKSEVLTLAVHKVLIHLLAVRRGRRPAPT